MFSQLRASHQRSAAAQAGKLPSSNGSDGTSTQPVVPRVLRTNTTHANSISLNAGNLVVGASLPGMASSRGTTNANDSSGDNNSTSPNHLRVDLPPAPGEGSRASSPLGKSLSPDEETPVFEMEVNYHEQRVSSEMVLLDLAKLKGIRQGDLCELMTYSPRGYRSDVVSNAPHASPIHPTDSSNGVSRKKIYFIAKDRNRGRKGDTNKNNGAASIKTTFTNTSKNTVPDQGDTTRGNTDDIGERKTHAVGSAVSILSGQLRTLLDIPINASVWIKAKSKNECALDLVEINLKDCYLNRGDMWTLSSHLQDTCLFSEQRLTFIDTIRGTVKGIYRDGKKVLSGYVGETTRVVFRSESARLIFLIQITEEMWNFEETGEKIFHKMVNSLFPKIFKKWKAIDTHHSITIAFAISMDLSDSSFTDLKPGERLKNPADHFRIVVDQVNIIHWVEIMETLKLEFLNIKNDLLNVQSEKGCTLLKGRFAPIIKSNFLELINFATTVLVDPFRQVDLRHTTTHVMIISPGSGLYDVDYDLLNLTGKKLLSLEMTMDLICLSRAPLHIVPLFRSLDYEKKLHYCIPNWLSIFFWNDSSKVMNEWHPRCKIYDLQMMGLTDNEIVEQADIPYLHTNIKKIHSINDFISSYEKETFNFPQCIQNEGNLRASLKSSSNKQGKSTDSKHTDKSSSSNNQKSLLWQNPSFSKPVTEGAQDLIATADILTATDSDIINTDGVVTESNGLQSTNSTNSLYDPDGISTSAAAKSLRVLGKKKSIRDIARGLITKISSGTMGVSNKSSNSSNGTSNRKYPKTKVLPTTEPSATTSKIETNKSQEVINAIMMPVAGPSKPGMTNESYVKHDLQNSGITEPKPVIQAAKLNPTTGLLSSFDKAERNPNLSTSNTITRPNTVDPVINSRPFTYFDNNPKYENNTYISNETWIEIRNPSVPVNTDIANKLLPVRWRDVWPHFVAKKYSKWRSFTTPADLPVTISAFPTKEDFSNNFFFRNHSVTLNIDQEAYNQTAKDLLRDIIYTRLITGFQICVGKQVERIENLTSKFESDSPVVKYIENKPWEEIKVYMIMDSEIHRITCSQNDTIDVQRYLRKNENDRFDQVPRYIPLIKTRYEENYRESMIDPIHVKRQSLNWNQIDQVIAGYGDYIIDKKWHGFRAKFVVLPSTVSPNNFSIIANGKSEVLTLEELRLEGLRRLINSITKCRLKSEKEKKMKKSKKDEIQPEVTFYTGSLLNFINEQQDSLKIDGSNIKDSLFVDENNLLNKNTELFKLAYEAQYGTDKLTLVNRQWHWKQHLRCFVGSEMVSWLVQNFSDIASREEALAFGQKLMDEGLFHHVLNKHNFLDGHYFYQFNSEYEIDDQKLEKIKSTIKPIKSSDTIKRDLDSTRSNTSQQSGQNSRISTRRDPLSLDKIQTDESRRPTVTLSNSVVIDIDSSNRSYKQEICTVHYDRVHNPDHCFHIRLEWLTATPKLIDDLLGNWSRMCERYGLRLVELPWEELCALPTMNPFHSFVKVKLAINPWEDKEFYDKELFASNKFYYHICLLKQSGFLLDNRASKFLQEGESNFEINYSWGKPQFKYAQYIHNTGAYIAEIRENGELFLAPNNIHMSRVTRGNNKGRFHSSSRAIIHSQTLVMEFKKLWTDYNALKKVFLDIKERWMKTQKINEF